MKNMPPGATKWATTSAQYFLPESDRYWSEVDYTPKWSFEDAARKALADESLDFSVRGVAGRIEEVVVHLVSPKLRR